jgi:antitoxin (DNA-binding transcriptional repressor) of toxin-antitoxin stability system
MFVMKVVSTAELKARLSHYLAEVREGGTVYVTSRGHRVARISRFSGGDALDMKPPERPISDLEDIKVRPMPSVEALSELLQDRARR